MRQRKHVLENGTPSGLQVDFVDIEFAPQQAKLFEFLCDGLSPEEICLRMGIRPQNYGQIYCRLRVLMEAAMPGVRSHNLLAQEFLRRQTAILAATARKKPTDDEMDAKFTFYVLRDKAVGA